MKDYKSLPNCVVTMETVVQDLKALFVAAGRGTCMFISP